MRAIKIANIRKSKRHTHTTAGTGQLIEGVVAFDKGAVVRVTGVDTWVSIGLTAAQAIVAGKFGTNFPVDVELAPGSRDLYVDAETGSEVSAVQVN